MKLILKQFAHNKKEWLCYIEKYPNCKLCNKPIFFNDKCIFCKENKAFYCYDCYSDEHFKTFKNDLHHDIPVTIKEDLKK